MLKIRILSKEKLCWWWPESRNAGFRAYIQKWIFAYCLLPIACCLLPQTNAQTLSPAAKVSVLTIGPGEELYSCFGHTMIRVSDPAIGADYCFNYGTFSFQTENFYVKFLRGTLPYTLSVSDFQPTLEYYSTRENRSVTEQILNLSASQKQRVFDLLRENFQPENREYRYKFFYDNCSTRPRDILLKACGDSLQFKYDSTSYLPQSFRGLMNQYLKQKPFARLGMNAAIGRPANQQATYMQAMYLPENLMIGLEKATLGSKPVVAKSIALYQAPPSGKPWWAWLFTPFVLVTIPLGVLLFWLNRNKPDQLTVFDKLFYATLGVFGLLLLLLWVATDHGVTALNVSLLGFLPTHLVVAWFLDKPKHQVWLRYYFWFTIVVGFVYFIQAYEMLAIIWVWSLARLRRFIPSLKE